MTGQGHRRREVPNETGSLAAVALAAVDRLTHDFKFWRRRSWYTPSLANRPRIDDQPTFTARLDVLL